MKLRNLFLIASAMSAITMMAVPAKQGLRTLTQPDGSTVKVRLVGDEFYHTYINEQGQPLMRDADGMLRVRDAETDRQMRRKAAQRHSARRAPRKASQVPQTGSPRIPVLLVQYKDYKFKDVDPLATFESFFKEGQKSAHQYFVDQSNGKYTPQFDVYGPITLSGNRATYGGNDWRGDDKGVGKMVGEACIGLDSSITFSDYDNDGDGECDVVIVLYAGDGEASSYEDDCEDAIWPCQWQLSASDYGKSLTLDRTIVDKFAVFNELNGTNISKIDGIGTFCHEFSHCLDLPDFYDTNYGPHFGMAHWSLLDYGCYNDDGYTPIGYTAYEKSFMGWLDLEEAQENTHYTLPVLNQKSAATDRAIKVTNPKDKNEYYILENRAKQGWDKYMPTEGLFIYHVTYSASAWSSNTVNDYDMQRMTPVPADNSLKIDKKDYYGETYYVVDEADLLGDLWPYGSATELTDTSVPAAKVNTGSLMGKPITEITRNADGTISFWAMKAPLPPVDTPVTAEPAIESETSATISWAPVNASCDVTYTLEVNEHRDITYELVQSAKFDSKDELDNWTVTGFAEYDSAEQALRMGSNKNTGFVESKEFTVGDDGVVTVRVNSKSWSGDDSNLGVALLNASGSDLTSKEVTLTNAYKDHIVTLTATPGTKVKVELSTIGKKKRVYVKEADIYNGDASEDLSASAQARAASGKYDNRTITGITGTSYTLTDLKAQTIYDYRVKAVPVDTENFGESAWSDKKSFTTSDNNSGSGIGEIATDADAVVEYYTLQGVKVAHKNLKPGIYIEVRGGKARKVVM